MADSIRQRIERAYLRAQKLADDFTALKIDVENGALVPADEHEAAVAEAVERERERCAKLAEQLQRDVDEANENYAQERLPAVCEDIDGYALAHAIRQPTQGGKEP